MCNDFGVVEVIRQVAAETIGEEKTNVATPMMGAEDFSYMIQKAPGAMFMLGARIGDENRPHHSPIFDVDENAFHIGAAILAETAVRLLREKA